MADLDIGELTERIKIRLWQDVPAFNSGLEQVFDAGVEVWAKIEPTGSAVYLGSVQIESTITHKITVRYSSEVNQRTVTAGHVIEDGFSRYRVKRANPYQGGKTWLLIEVELLGDVEVADEPD